MRKLMVVSWYHTTPTEWANSIVPLGPCALLLLSAASAVIPKGRIQQPFYSRWCLDKYVITMKTSGYVTLVII